jgi:hypothetical protein
VLDLAPDQPNWHTGLSLRFLDTSQGQIGQESPHQSHAMRRANTTATRPTGTARGCVTVVLAVAPKLSRGCSQPLMRLLVSLKRTIGLRQQLMRLSIKSKQGSLNICTKNIQFYYLTPSSCSLMLELLRLLRLHVVRSPTFISLLGQFGL